MEILYIALAVLFLLDPRAAAEAAVISCNAMKDVVVKSLFPMMVLSRLISHSSVVTKLTAIVAKSRIWKRLQLSDSLLPAVLTGYLSGLPAAARDIAELEREGKVTGREASKAIALASLPSPAFVITIASDNIAYGLIRYVVLVLTAYIVSSCFFSQKSFGGEKNDSVNLVSAISSSSLSAISVSANIVFFSAISCTVSDLLPWAKQWMYVFLEMGSGVIFANGDQFLVSVILGWCGLSAMSQIRSEANGISVIPYATVRVVSSLSMTLLHIFLQKVL